MGGWLLRGLGLVYLVAFTSLRRQVLGLFGRRGIVPVHRQLAAARAGFGFRDRPWQRWAAAPTLLWLDDSDRALVRLCTAGQASGAALMAGLAPKLSAWAAWVFHLSFLVVGSPFLAYQWDALLAEAGLLGALGAPARRRLQPGTAIKGLPLWLLRLLCFRLHFESGLAKIHSRDRTWRHLLACAYHYETQPLPTPLAFHAGLLPLWVHRLATAVVLVVETAAPFLAFGGRRARKLGWMTLEALQALIAATGNFAYFNVLTAVVALSLVDGPGQARARPRRARRWSPTGAGRPARWVLRPLEAALAGTVGVLAIAELAGRLIPGRFSLDLSDFRPLRWLEDRTSAFRPVSSYGLFANMTTTRPEIVIEGSDDGRGWRAYEFPHKPGDLGRGPRWVAPHQPRLDWQMWFAALSPVPPSWFAALMARLLEGSPEVLSLFALNPFPDHPPRYVRALLYRYRMVDRPTHRRTGRWWHRDPVGLYIPPVRLASGHA